MNPNNCFINAHVLLQQAALTEHLDMIHFLLNHGADVNHLDNNGYVLSSLVL